MLQETENENEEEAKEIEIDIKTIHTVYAVKDWMFEMVDKTELSKKNYFYRVYSKVAGVAVIDYDKTNIVPIVKDILNRQNTFIEIKYLRWSIWLNIVIMLWLIIIGILIPFWRPTFDTQKTEILWEIRKYWLQAIQKQDQWNPEPPKVLTPSNTSTTTTSTPGYSPIMPTETNINNKKNIPSYAN